ncbi:hypothetical protein, partial [Mobiluncus mulieris]
GIPHIYRARHTPGCFTVKVGAGSRGAGRGLASIWMRAGLKPGRGEKLNPVAYTNRKLTR